MPGALTGLKVLDLSRGAAGAIAGMFLADHGADVWRLIGDDVSAVRGGGFRVWDRGKRVCMAPPDDLARMVGHAAGFVDIVLEDYAPGERPEWLSAAELARINPRMVSCSITACGECGPHRDMPPVDDLVLAHTGILAGLPGFRPAPIHCVHPLPSTGAGILAALGICAALFARETTGMGRHVATSLVAGALLYHPKVSGGKLPAHVFQTNPYGSAPFYSVYRCADDAWIQLGCVHPGFIARAAELMGLAELIQDPVYGRGHLPKTQEADAHLRGAVAEVMAMRAGAAWAELFEANDIPFAPSRHTEDALDDPQIRHNGMVVGLEDPEVGMLEQMGIPVKLGITPGAVRAPRSGGPEPCPWTEPDTRLSRGAATDLRTLPGQTAEAGRMARPLPLAGIRVLEITNLIAGPIAGRLLADLGAEVMKLEPPSGDISRPIRRTYFFCINSAKRSVAVDTAQPDGKAVVARLAAASDVVLANLRPGATQWMGIGHAADPDVVETQISGYGLTGPYAHRPGIDPLAQALMGLQRAQGGHGNPPSFPAQLAPTDFTTGAMAALGTTLALLARARGLARGQRVEVNLLDGGAMLCSEWFTRYRGRPERPLADAGQHGPHALHRLYGCADGHIYIAADGKDGRGAVARAIGIDDGLPDDEASATETIAQKLAALRVQDAVTGLRKANVPAAAVAPAASAAFFDDPGTAVNGWMATADHPTLGPLTTIRHFVQFDDAADTGIRPTPLLGEHSAEILREAGFDSAEIEELMDARIVLAETGA